MRVTDGDLRSQRGPDDGHDGRAGWLVGAGILAFVAAAIGPSLIGHNTLLSVDSLSADFPWLANGSHLSGHELCSGDTIDSGMPGISYIRNQLFSGHLPNWQNLVAGGSASASQPDLGLLNPLSLPYFVLPLWLAPAFVKLLQLIVAIAGTFGFLRLHRVGRPASLLAGFAFAVSGFMVMWTNWPQTVVAAFIPALFWATERLIRRARAVDAVPVAIVVGSMLLGGFPAVTGWAIYAAAAYLVVRILLLHKGNRRAIGRRIGIAASGLLLGAMVSMVQLLPFAYQYRATNLSYRAHEALESLPFGSLDTLVAPNANGLCIGGTVDYGTWVPIETVAYMGAAALVLAILGMAISGRGVDARARGVRSTFLVTIAVIIVLGWAGGYALHLVSALPVFSGNFIGRIRSLLGFLLAVFVGFGFDALLRKSAARDATDEATDDTANEDRGHRADRPFARGQFARTELVVIAWAALAVAVLFFAYRDAHTQSEAKLWSQRTFVPGVLVLVAIGCVALAFYGRRHSVRRLAIYVLLLLIFGQAFQFFHTVLPGDSRDNFYPVTPTHEFLKANLGENRFVSTGGTLYPATSLYYGLRSVTGHTFHQQSWKEMLETVDTSAMVSGTFSQISESLTPRQLADSKVLDQMSAQYLVVDPTGLVGGDQPISVGGASVTIGQQQAGSCVLPGGPLRGVSVWFAKNWIADNSQRGVTMNVTVSAAGKTVTSGRFLGTGVPAGAEISIATAAESFPTGNPITVTVTGTGSASPLVLAGRGDNGAISCASVRPQNDGLKLVFADSGSIVYQRLTSLPRIRWASSSIVVGDDIQRLTTLEGGLRADEVMLSAPGPTAAGKPATVTVRTDSSDRTTTDVDAAGAGYLVIADALQEPGWSATVDGKKAMLVHADEAMVAVFVPAGKHTVRVSYQAQGQLAGAGLTGLAIIIMIGLGLTRRAENCAEAGG